MGSIDPTTGEPYATKAEIDAQVGDLRAGAAGPGGLNVGGRWGRGVNISRDMSAAEEFAAGQRARASLGRDTPAVSLAAINQEQVPYQTQEISSQTLANQAIVDTYMKERGDPGAQFPWIVDEEVTAGWRAAQAAPIAPAPAAESIQRYVSADEEFVAPPGGGQPSAPAAGTGTVAAAAANAAREVAAVNPFARDAVPEGLPTMEGTLVPGSGRDRSFQWRSPVNEPGAFAKSAFMQSPTGVAASVMADKDIAASTRAVALGPTVASSFIPGGFIISGLAAGLNAMGGYTDLGPANPDNISNISVTGAGNLTYDMEGPGGGGVMTNPLSIMNALNDLDAQNPGAKVDSKFGSIRATDMADIQQSRAAGQEYDLSNPSGATAAQLMDADLESESTSKEEEEALAEGGPQGLAALAGLQSGTLDDPGFDYGPGKDSLSEEFGKYDSGQGFWSGLASAFTTQTGPGTRWGGAGPAYGIVDDGMGGSRAPVGPWDAGGPLTGGGTVGSGLGLASAGATPGGEWDTTGIGAGTGYDGASGAMGGGYGSFSGYDDGGGSGYDALRVGGLIKRGYANGGQVQPQPQQNPIVQGAIAAIMGNHPQPRQAIAQFVQVYGQQAFTALRQQVIADTTEQQREGSGLGAFVQGQGDGLSDSIPANIDGQEPVALSDGEVVVPADVVSGLGNGSSEAGAKKIEEMGQKIRQKRTGSKKQPRAVDASQVIMGMA